MTTLNRLYSFRPEFEKTQTQRSQGTCLRPHSLLVVEVNYKARPLSSKASVVFFLTTTLTMQEADPLGLEEAPGFLYL